MARSMQLCEYVWAVFGQVALQVCYKHMHRAIDKLWQPCRTDQKY